MKGDPDGAFGVLDTLTILLMAVVFCVIGCLAGFAFAQFIAAASIIGG